ncbi:hypothetical protein FHR24_001473 [Wenyingzhuangia heitensis]|uniref:3'-5' exoribonuclease Rv2179c-like domain-containing protein n=1 Tax=Wenyingzhuangia heitensis TaxID=1487859 RepID=A0ABX0U865_9FLAO|nr:3'-5' exonuclease [Wenyingzhuangia heitensis]NIJ45034.1 hypothetical protein [Wenyingzhuangia heitensis]
MEHLMIDIETFGNKSHSVIVNIGAVCFDLKTGEIGSIFQTSVSADDCVKNGLKINADTFFWWLEQSKEAQDKIVKDRSEKSLKIALLNLGRFVYDNCPPDVQVWGNSARFDLGILENAYDAIGFDLPWNHKKERDVRTLVMFNPKIKSDYLNKHGVAHDPISDCKGQIRYCCDIFNTISVHHG